MSKGFSETDALCRELVADARKKIFRPVYLLMGEEPYYPDMVCDAIIDNALDESERDFNQYIFYGADVTADTVVTTARRFPMFSERQLVVVKEAQMMRSLDDLSVYCSKPLESTVLVICLHGASADKRKSLYRSVAKIGAVVESNPVRDYDISRWITAFYAGKGLRIAPDAAALLGEHAGTDLGKIAVETDKLMKNLPEGTVSVSVKDIERNVGISRQYSIFELTRELSVKNAPKALRIAAYIGASPKFAMPMAVSALFTHFYRILKYEALLMDNPRPGNDQKAKVLGVNPYFFGEYDKAVSSYPLKKCMAVISLLKEFDFKGKGGDTGEATPEQLLTELVTRILN